jgi:Tol biopolymer transport system component
MPGIQGLCERPAGRVRRESRGFEKRSKDRVCRRGSQRNDKGFDAEIHEEQTKLTRIFVVDSDIETDDEPVKLETAGSASEISFSPDGSKIVAALAPTAKIDDFYMYRRIRVIDAESGTEVAAIDNPGKLGPIKWSPSAKYLAICSGEGINDPSAGRLTVASVDGVTQEDLRSAIPIR